MLCTKFTSSVELRTRWWILGELAGIALPPNTPSETPTSDWINLLRNAAASQLYRSLRRLWAYGPAKQLRSDGCCSWALQNRSRLHSGCQAAPQGPLCLLIRILPLPTWILEEILVFWQGSAHRQQLLVRRGERARRRPPSSIPGTPAAPDPRIELLIHNVEASPIPKQSITQP